MSHTEKKKSLGHLEDCRALKPTELRRRYKAEENTHRNILQRAKKQGRVVHPEFHKFADFLAHVGPRPCAGATLDRIDNNDPEYAPGKVRWADKRTQNSNKGDTLLFYYAPTRDTYTTSRLAKLQGVSPSTVRKRKERGWTDVQIIEGNRNTAPVVINPGHDMPPPGRAPRLYTPTHRQPPVRSARDIQFEEDREYFESSRQESGQEPCWDDYETATKECAECGIVLTARAVGKALGLPVEAIRCAPVPGAYAAVGAGTGR